MLVFINQLLFRSTTWNFIGDRLQHRCFLENFSKTFRDSGSEVLLGILQNFILHYICYWLLPKPHATSTSSAKTKISKSTVASKCMQLTNQ